MRSVRSVLAMVLLVACVGASASAANSWFNNTSGDGLWSTPTNWSAGLPNAANDGMIAAYAVSTNVTCQADVSHTNAWMYVGYGGYNGTLNITTPGVTIGTSYYLSVGSVAGTTGTINVGNGGKYQNTGGWVNYIGDGGTGIVNVNAGGTWQSALRINVGQAGGNGTFNVAGGTVTAPDMVVGNSGTGALAMSGGSLTASAVYVGLGGAASVNISGSAVLNGDLYIGYTNAATGVMSGGTVNAANLLVDVTGFSGILDISGGTINAGALGIGALGMINFTSGSTGKIVLPGLVDLSGLMGTKITGASATYDGTNTIIAVPEPATMVLLGLGAMGLISRKRKS